MDVKSKLKSQSTTDFFIKCTSEDLNIPKELIENVIKDSYRQSLKAIRDTENTYLDMNGLGTFKISSKRVKSRITKFEKIKAAEIKKDPEKYATHIINLDINIQHLKEKLESKNRKYGEVDGVFKAPPKRSYKPRRDSPILNNECEVGEWNTGTGSGRGDSEEKADL